MAAASLLLLTGANAQTVKPAAPYYDLVALRVEFAPDTSGFTTGDGTFSGLSLPIEPKVDPLPHDAAYFEAHLAFLEHYIRTASAGRTKVVTHLIPEVVRLDNPMATYSPIGVDSDSKSERSKLANLIRDAWTKADVESTFDPVRLLHRGNIAFILFHAGVGRDVELVGTTLDKTPQDLPSVFMGTNTLAELGVGGLTFRGLPVDHSLIIPRTETRSGVNAFTDEPYLLELSINGLLAASFISYLGVPDLFNTDTGESVIGPFGVMDPLGIFAYRGLFPPLPSAWTRTALGWATPKEIHDPGVYDLAAGDIARIEISEAEYFLLENRVRTSDDTGLMLHIFNEGTISTQRFSAVSDDFDRFNVQAFKGGVVTQASSYDFALPGRDADNQQYNGGILIWHIDERQFSRAVNNDPDALAVDIEEADGAQDIGFDGNIGSPFDFYFSDNPSSVALPSGLTFSLYENRFGPDTTPDSRTNEGGNSFLTLEDFSASGPIMSFSFQKEAGEHVTDAGTVALGTETTPGGSVGMVAGQRAVFTGTEAIVPGVGQVSALARPAYGAQGMAVVDDQDGSITFTEYEIIGERLTATRSVTLSAELPVGGPVVYYDNAHYAHFTGSDQSIVFRIASGVDRYDIDDRGLGLAATDEGVYFIGQSQAGPVGEVSTWTYMLGDDAGYPVMGRDRTGLWGAIPLSTALVVLQPDGETRRIAASAYLGDAVFSSSLAIADLDQNGVLDLITTAGNRVVAFSQGGALLPPFPIEIGASATSAPLIFQSDDAIIIVVSAADGNIYALDLDQKGRVVPGFPLSAGRAIKATSLILSDTLSVVTESGILRNYKLNNINQVLWAQQHGSGQNVSFVALAAKKDETAPLLNVAETYNWPNPIRDGHTFFRCLTSEASQISVTVVDAAGSLVGSLNFATSAGVPHEAAWNTSAASGMYFARVEATSVSGRTDSHLIKLAIIR
jgi:hypothetical protein